MLFVTLKVASSKVRKIEPVSAVIPLKKYGLVEFSSSTKLSTARKEATVKLTTIIKYF